MHFGILQCDSVRPDLRESFGDYPDMFRRRLSALDDDLAFSTWNLPAGSFPESPAAVDGWLITGSKRSVYEDEPWIAQAHELVRAIDAARAPLVGVCFGHQLVARALGGEVERAGWGVGVHTTRIGEPQPWMRPAARTLSLLVSHQDQVTKPPQRARVLAGHDFCPYDIMAIDDHIITFQGHPEFERGYSRALMEIRRETLGEATYREGVASLQSEVQGELAARWMLAFVGRAPGAQSSAAGAGRD